MASEQKQQNPAGMRPRVEKVLGTTAFAAVGGGSAVAMYAGVSYGVEKRWYGPIAAGLIQAGTGLLVGGLLAANGMERLGAGVIAANGAFGVGMAVQSAMIQSSQAPTTTIAPALTQTQSAAPSASPTSAPGGRLPNPAGMPRNYAPQQRAAARG